MPPTHLAEPGEQARPPFLRPLFQNPSLDNITAEALIVTVTFSRLIWPGLSPEFSSGKNSDKIANRLNGLNPESSRLGPLEKIDSGRGAPVKVEGAMNSARR